MTAHRSEIEGYIMNKYLVLITFLGCCVQSFSQTVLHLRPVAGYAGHDSIGIHVDQMSPGALVHLEMVVTNLDQSLAGAAFSIYYPAYLTLMDDAKTAFDSINPPFSLGVDVPAANAIRFPTSGSGQPLTRTIENERGRSRFAFVIDDPSLFLPESSQEQVIAEFVFKLGNETNPYCTTNSTQIFLWLDGQVGDMLVDDKAEIIPITLDPSDVTVNLLNSNSLQKGNLSLYQDGGDDNGLSEEDVVALIRCVNFGQGGCNLASLSLDQYSHVTDIDCSSGDPNYGDVFALTTWLQGSVAQFMNKSDVSFQAISVSKSVVMEASDLIAIFVQVAVPQGMIEADLSEEDALAGWHLQTNYDPVRNMNHLCYTNLSGIDKKPPDLSLLTDKREAEVSASGYRLDGSKVEIGFAPIHALEAENE